MPPRRFHPRLPDFPDGISHQHSALDRSSRRQRPRHRHPARRPPRPDLDERTLGLDYALKMRKSNRVTTTIGTAQTISTTLLRGPRSAGTRLSDAIILSTFRRCVTT